MPSCGLYTVSVLFGVICGKQKNIVKREPLSYDMFTLYSIIFNGK